MKAFIDMTQWDDGKSFHHVYWMDDAKNKAYAYAKWGNPADVQVFKKPIQIDARGRKFEPVRNIFGFVDRNEPAAQQWKFTGSKGDEYIVEKGDNGYTCTCSGFRFRGGCKHVTEVELVTSK
jgi:hypothetical protein